MCSKTECLYSFPARKTCLVLSVINAIGNGLLLLFWFYLWGIYYSSKEPEDYNHSGILGGIYWGSSYTSKGDAMDDYLNRGLFTIPVTFWLSVVTWFTAITFAFSVILCRGVYERRPGYVKVYFLFGVVATFLAALVSIVRIVLWIVGVFNGPGGLWGLVPCAIHSLFLVLVYRTHVQLLEDAKPPCIQVQEVTTRMLPTAPALNLLEEDSQRTGKIYGVD